MNIVKVEITFEDGSTEIITPASHLVPQNQGISLQDLGTSIVRGYAVIDANGEMFSSNIEDGSLQIVPIEKVEPLPEENDPE